MTAKNFKDTALAALGGLLAIFVLLFNSLEYIMLGLTAFCAVRGILSLYHHQFNDGIAFSGIAIVMTLWYMMWEQREHYGWVKKNLPKPGKKLKERKEPRPEPAPDPIAGMTRFLYRDREGLAGVFFAPAEIVESMNRMNAELERKANSQPKHSPFTIFADRHMKWVKTLFGREGTKESLLKLKSEIAELEEAINNRDEDACIAEGVDVILTTLSLLSHVPNANGGRVWKGLCEKAHLNQNSEWVRNGDGTHSRVKPASRVEQSRIIAIYKRTYVPINDSELAQMATDITAMYAGSNATDAELIENIKAWFNTHEGAPQTLEEARVHGLGCDNYHWPASNMNIGDIVRQQGTDLEGPIECFIDEGMVAQFINTADNTPHTAHLSQLYVVANKK